MLFRSAYGFLSADGSTINRIKGGLEGGVSGAVIGAALPVAVNFGTKAFRRVFQSSSIRPTMETLRATKTVAYDAADKAGIKFSAQEMDGLKAAVQKELAGSNYVPGVDRQTDAVMSILDNKSASDMTLGQLDKLRQNFFKRYDVAKNETGILDAIDAIDTLIASKSNASELMDAARLANSRFKKAETLDLAFQKAADQTAATGSGGNILNKYRQAVTNIINNPKQAKWFTAEEIDTMRKFIQGSTTQNVLRKIGKLAPGGNGLMTALNLGAVSYNPGMLGVTAAASGAKAISDGMTASGAEKLIGTVAGGMQPRIPGPVTYPLNALAGATGAVATQTDRRLHAR